METTTAKNARLTHPLVVATNDAHLPNLAEAQRALGGADQPAALTQAEVTVLITATSYLGPFTGGIQAQTIATLGPLARVLAVQRTQGIQPVLNWLAAAAQTATEVGR